MDLLRKVDPKLEPVNRLGLVRHHRQASVPVLNYTADKLTHNWGWAIILVTVAINTVLFPLKITSMKSSAQDARLQPEVTALKPKYKGLKMKRSEEGRAEPGIDGPVQEARHQPCRRLPCRCCCSCLSSLPSIKS